MSKSTEFLEKLQAKGQVTFATKEYAGALDLSAIAATHSLNRLRQKRLIATPLKGFHVILGPADRANGSRPPEEFINYLMQFLGERYYVALLSAAEIYGAAHHRPQEFQVMVQKNRREIKCGRVRIKFIAHSGIAGLPVVKRKVKTGYITVSTPEITALDLIAYPDHAAGLDNVATVLHELSESLAPEKLKEAATSYEIACVQRLGFILETIGSQNLANGLLDVVANHARRATPLMPGKLARKREINKRWRVIVNERLEPDL